MTQSEYLAELRHQRWEQILGPNWMEVMAAWIESRINKIRQV